METLASSRRSKDPQARREAPLGNSLKDIPLLARPTQQVRTASTPVTRRPSAPGLGGEEEDPLKPGPVWGVGSSPVGAGGPAVGGVRRLCGGGAWTDSHLEVRVSVDVESPTRPRRRPRRDPRALWLGRAVLTSPDSETSQQFLVVLAAFASANTNSRRQETEALPARSACGAPPPRAVQL
uniref:Uncharacterized protein n=1 Tax=Rangifer tarandus platyrhynchus TaxID=3082113 RepID=A0ACB0FDN8_RANTA|nr:unnamed protein product [Rangifer tarandus platyrhynchus]